MTAERNAARCLLTGWHNMVAISDDAVILPLKLGCLVQRRTKNNECSIVSVFECLHGDHPMVPRK